MSFVIICVLSGILLLSITAVTIALIAVRLNKRSTAQLTAVLQQQAELIQALRHQFELSDSGFHGMGKRMVELEKRVSKTMQKADSMDTRDPQAAAYKHAVKLVERGAAIDDIVKSCGLSRSEAELVKVLKTQLNSDNLVRTAG